MENKPFRFLDKFDDSIIEIQKDPYDDAIIIEIFCSVEKTNLTIFLNKETAISLRKALKVEINKIDL
jgi:hypothetical protein